MRRKPNPYPSLVFLIFLTRFAIGDDATVMDNFSKSLTPTPSTWKKGSNFCTGWEGVKCDSSGHVTSIDLQNKGLSGSLPSDLNQLAQLQQLSLQKNQLSGPLPSFSDLTNLADIFLANNNFTSVPPSAFSGLSGLKTLSLSNNVNLDPWLFPGDLTGSDQLEMVDASNVNLFGPLPDIFDKFSSLQSLRLSYNNLTGFLPATFANSPIRNLTLNNQVNGLSGRIDVIGKMSQLSQVWLHVNAFSGPIPDLSNCTSLSDFRVRDNQLTGLVPSSLTTNPGLVHAEISNNNLQGPLPVFGKQVTTDAIAQNNFCDTKPGPCDPRVTTLLDIAGALGYPMSIAEAWSKNDPCKDWDFLTCDTDGNITVINFSKQKFGGFISPAFSNLTKLKNMMLNDNNLTGSIPSSLTSLTALQVLDVSNNNLSGKVPTFPTGVTVKTQGNTLIGKDVPSGGGDGSGGSGGPSGSNGSEGSASGKSGHSSLPSGLIAGIIILVVLIVCVTCLVSYRIYKKKHSKEFDLVKNPQNGNGKQVVSNGSSGIKINGYDGVGHELLSQSSDDRSDVQFFEGGNVVISFEVLRQVTDNFSEHKILGRGGFGVVYKGELHDGTQIAVKRMESGIMGTKGLKEFQAEIAVLTKVRHRHLVALLGFCTNGNEKLLVYEHMPQGTLSQHLFEWRELGYKPLTWKQRVTIALDVARGVEYLHSLAQQSFIHRDLKPSNILLGDDMRAKVADFGLVKNAPDGKYSVETKLAGTFGYLAPEYAVTGRVTTKVDVYAFGVVLMELVTGRKALDETMPEDRSHLVTWFRRVLINKNDTKKCIDPTLDPDDETSEIICKVAELAGHCTSREPSQRPDMGHAVNILAPLVQQWKPTTEELDDSFGIDFQMSLPQALERWQSREGTSTMVGDTYHGRTISLGDTQSSIPSMLEGFPNTMGSTDAR